MVKGKKGGRVVCKLHGSENLLSATQTNTTHRGGKIERARQKERNYRQKTNTERRGGEIKRYTEIKGRTEKETELK